MRAVNRAKLRDLIRGFGEKAVERVAIGSNVSASLLQKVLADTYGRVPTRATRERLCSFLGVAESEIFPVVDGDKKKTG